MSNNFRRWLDLPVNISASCGIKDPIQTTEKYPYDGQSNALIEFYENIKEEALTEEDFSNASGFDRYLDIPEICKPDLSA